MNLSRWEPFREMEDIVREFSPMFRRSLPQAASESWRPIANISETEREYLIKAELPEVKKEDVKITLQDGVITISGERKQVKEQKDENEIRVESFYGSFSRSFSLPDNIDADSIKAESKDGVLKVHLPKVAAPKSKAKSITVQ